MQSADIAISSSDINAMILGRLQGTEFIGVVFRQGLTTIRQIRLFE